MVPILDALEPVLKKWHLKTGGEGLVMLRCASTGSTSRYQATRHTFASQWVLAGGSIEKLKEVLGHYSVVVTERYTHLRPDLFAPKDLSTIALDLKGA